MPRGLVLLFVVCSLLIIFFFPRPDQSSTIQFWKNRCYDGTTMHHETEVVAAERFLDIGDSTMCCPFTIFDHLSSVVQFSGKDDVSFSPVTDKESRKKASTCAMIQRWRYMSCISSSSSEYGLEQRETRGLTEDVVAFPFMPILFFLMVYVYQRTRVSKMTVDEADASTLDGAGYTSVMKVSIQKFFCKVCLEAKPLDQSFKNKYCIHLFCTECVTNNVATKIRENSTIIRCMEIGCTSKIEMESCRDILASELLERWAILLIKSLVFSSKNMYCPFADCGALLWDNRKESGKKVLRQAECPHCCRLVCAHCNVGWHAGMSCRQFQKLKKKNTGRNEAKMKELANEKHWQRCPRCRLYVEKVSGCVHITCRCGFQFCYMCGSSWSDYKHKCRLKRLLKSWTSWSTWRSVLRQQLR